tara:strand:+ start:118 stop:1029 length:912 start_codon:yes stop_codon:yes gene_type:complete
MFTLLLLTTLPLFGLVFVGFALGKFSLFNNQDAKVFLKLIGILVVPTLGIKIIGEFNYQHIKWDLYFLYLVSQFLIYFTGFFIAKLIFKRSNAESLIIGMTSAFSNHLFFVYPIALFEFATKDIVPIETIISADFITVGLSVCALDVATQKNIKIKSILFKQFKNPALIGLLLGLIVFLLKIDLPLSLDRLVDFICDTGTPCALIAMGILLSYKTNRDQIKLSLIITFLKVLLFPILLFSFIFLFEYDLNISKTTMMVAAAPIGAMGLIFASIYNVKTDAVVRAGIFTYILSLIGIPIVGSIA